MSELHPTQTARTPGEEILAVNAVSHGYDKAHGELLILDGVNLSLRAGEIVGLLGRSGSGKSTLLRIIAGLVTPTAGAVNYLGRPLNGPAQGVAMVFQTFALFPGLRYCKTSRPGWRRWASPLPNGASGRWRPST